MELKAFMKLMKEETKRWAGFGFVIATLITKDGVKNFLYHPMEKYLYQFKLTGSYFKDSIIVEGPKASLAELKEAFKEGYVQIKFTPKEKYKDTYPVKILFQGGKIYNKIKGG